VTVAVCYQCGALKHGAFCPCGKCAAVPQSEDELALSLAMTDHYFDRPTLEQMGAAVRQGRPPHLDPKTRADLVATLRGSGLLEKLNKIQGTFREGGAEPAEGRQPPRRPWWRFW
jgi:hypothetical protein